MADRFPQNTEVFDTDGVGTDNKSMKYLILFSLTAISLNTWGQVDYKPFLGREVDKINIYNPAKSNWVSTFGFEAQGLPVERNFQGLGKSFQDKNEMLAGARLGFGRDFYLGKGFTTRTQVEGYFVGTLFEPKKSVTSEDKKAENSYSQKDGNIWGGEISQVLSHVSEFNAPNFIGDHKIKMYFEPFLEAGIGMGKTNFRFDYLMNTQTVAEKYRKVLDNTFLSQKVSIGVNIISNTGYFLTLKASQLAHRITDSKSYEMVGQNGAMSRRDVDQKDDSVNFAYSYYLGGGYKW